MLASTTALLATILLLPEPASDSTRSLAAEGRRCRVTSADACHQCGLTDGPSPVHGEDPQIIFLNFDDVVLEVGGDDDARNNVTVWSNLAGPWAGYPEWTPEAREQARERVATIFAPFDIQVTVTRPESGDYTMVVIGAHGDHSGGFSTSDCDNVNPNTIAFVSALPESLADFNLLAHEAGHSFGLGHTDTPVAEIMNPVVWDDSQLGTACAPEQSGYCGEVWQQHCPPGQQDSHATLCGTLGAWDETQECPLTADPQPDPNEPGDDGGSTGGVGSDGGVGTGDDGFGEDDGPFDDDGNGDGDGNGGEGPADDGPGANVDDGAGEAGTEDGSSSGTGDAGADDDGADGACSCRSARPAPMGWLALVMLAAMRRRR